MEKEKIIILGGRRGLGRHVLEQWQGYRPTDELFASSRKEFSLPGAKTFICDLSDSSGVKIALQRIEEIKPQRLFYMAGGGPYGPYTDKAWKDHQWAWNVSFLSAAQILHACLKKDHIQQMVFVGSRIAEAKADPHAASYAAAKHALKGLIASLQDETDLDLRLFSPGYMQTDMLPPAVRARLEGHPIQAPNVVAKEFIDWVQDTSASWHKESGCDI